MFRESIIEALATCIGDPIKIDGNTFHASRGKFARFCVEVKTDSPLELGICINGTVYQVVYENLPSICHSCGRVGHLLENCKYAAKQTGGAENPVHTNNMDTGEELCPPAADCLKEKARNKEYGSWMVMSRIIITN